MSDLTTIALPTEALERLRSLWESGEDELLRNTATLLLRDLFGGIDGHLTRIDEVLPPEDDGAPCCRAQVTAGRDSGQHEPGCYHEDER